MTSSACVCGCARRRVEYFRCEVRELIDKALAVDLVEDAASVVVPAAAAQMTHLYERMMSAKLGLSCFRVFKVFFKT